MKVIRCLHTAILVSDLNKAQKFYGDILGLPLSKNRSLKFPGLWYQIGDFQLHLIVDRDFTVPLPNQEKWGRNPHLALEIENLEIAKSKLQNAGYPIQMSASGRAALFTQDPDGNIIELGQIQ